MSDRWTLRPPGWTCSGEDRSIVAMKVNGGETRDLARELTEGDRIEPVLITSPEGLAILRHSTAHVSAQAVQNLHAEAKLGIGPPITDGFYYDFQLAEPFTPESLKAIQKQMVRIIKEKQTFVRRVVDDETAKQELADEPFKLELVDLKGDSSADDGSAMEVGAGELTIYDNVRRNGETAWFDLCRGPHVPHTGTSTPAAVAVTRSSAAYWRGGNQANAQLQRLYGTAWATKEDLQAYQHRLEEAAKRDHRKLGAELDLFSFPPEEIGSGLPVFHPQGRDDQDGDGGVLPQAAHRGRLLLRVHPARDQGPSVRNLQAPGVVRRRHVPADEDRRGTRRGRQHHPAGVDYYLKPMNCPMHNLVFQSRGRSYRELPLRLFEFGTVYRYEKSGVVHGLTRARGFTQDDAHIYTTREQMKEELGNLLTFILGLLKDYGLDDFYLELSTRDPEKSVGDDATWEEATRTLAEVATESGLTLVDDPGGAAFYGPPKISVQAKDAIGRTWQLSTIQLDFFEPELFELEYTAPRRLPAATGDDPPGPVRLHRAILRRPAGALRRRFPVWLAPVQVVGIPVAGEFNAYLEEVAAKLRAHGVRVEVDTSDDRMQKKIRNAQKDKVPYMLIAGGEDRDAGAVSFRYRDGSQNNGGAGR